MAGNNSMKLNKSTKARSIAARHAAGEDLQDLQDLMREYRLSPGTIPEYLRLGKRILQAERV